MEMRSIEEACTRVKEYLAADDVRNPLFVAFDSSIDLSCMRNSLASCETVRVSDFCNTPQSLPDEDSVFSALSEIKPRKIMLLGLGEYSALTGSEEFAKRIFGMALTAGVRIVVPMWNGYSFLEECAAEDPRIPLRRAIVANKTGRHWKVKSYKNGINDNPEADGFKSLLALLESGRDNDVSAVTAVRLNDKWCREINSAYAVYAERHPGCSLPQSMFSEMQWKRFLDETREREENIFSADGLLSVLEQDISADEYVQFALSRTKSYADWKWNLVNAILQVDPDEGRFVTLYNQRKALLKGGQVAERTGYVENTRRFSEPARQVQYLTDSTLEERGEILRLVTRGGALHEGVRRVYPLLADYAHNFSFSGQELAGLLTSYFKDYKRQKLLNCIEPRFLSRVREISEERPQFALPTRESVLEKLEGDNVALFWLDGLGCEFLGLIQSVAERQGLKMKVTPTRSRLPSITSENKEFFETWSGIKFDKRNDLDKIKHGDFEGETEGRREYPAHLQYELIAVENTITEIAKWLKCHATGKVVLTSDHGATRLAVISDSETTWTMPEKGVHGGRCCKVSEFDGELPSCSTISDDDKWHVLAGYDRFKGGRAGSVEVHGGGTLEEMVVPVIEFELLDHAIHVELIETEFKVTYKDSEIKLVLFSTSKLSSPTFDLGGIRYAVKKVDGMGRYEVRVPKPTAGAYSADVFDGDTKVGSVRFTVKSGGATVDSMDDFFGG